MPSLPGASVEADRAMDEGESPDGPSEGDACQNGPMPQLPGPPSALSPTKSPVGPDAPPGVAGFHDNLRKSQGTSAEGSVRKEALQSLRRSLPMQETQLCKHPTHLLPSPPSPAPVSHHLQRRSVWSQWTVRLLCGSISEREDTSSWSDIRGGTPGPDLKGLCVPFVILGGEQAACGELVSTVNTLCIYMYFFLFY